MVCGGPVVGDVLLARIQAGIQESLAHGRITRLGWFSTFVPDDLDLIKPAKIPRYGDIGVGSLFIGGDPQASGRLQLTPLPITQGKTVATSSTL